MIKIPNDPYEAKCQFLINKRESTELMYLNGPKASIEYSNYMEDVYKNIKKHKLSKKREVFIVFDDVIVDMINNKRLNPVRTELFNRGRILNISIVSIT